MEHQKTPPKPIKKILKYLPRATSSVSFQNPQVYSPAKDKKPSEKPNKSNLGIGLSGPMMSIVPSDTRRKIKNVQDPTFTLVYEPTSPRVSCMGQVKCKHYRKLAANAANQPTNKFSRATSFTPVTTYKEQEDIKDQEKVTKVDPVVTKSKKTSRIKSLLRGGSRKRSDANDNKCILPVNLPKAPSLGMMKRFSSGRDAFANFDWTTQVTPLDCAVDQRNYYSDDEREGGRDGEEVVVPSSAPVMERNKGVCDNFVRVNGVNLEQRKEINLWKRRTMAQPKPLQLHLAN